MKIGIEVADWIVLSKKLSVIESERNLLLCHTRQLLEALDGGRVHLSDNIRAFVLETRLRGIVAVIDAREKR